MKNRKKIGLALGSGSARGFSHIGIIRVLVQEGIPVDCIAGTSIGAVVGAFYASATLQDYEVFLKSLDWKKVTSLLDPLFPVSGLLGGKRIEKFLASLLHDRTIEDFSLPFAAVAADVVTGEEVVLTQGNAVKAVRASMSLPGIFTPVFLQDRFLVDGGVVSPVPVHAARMLGADVVIAVNLAAEMSKRTLIPTVKDTAEQFREMETRETDESPSSKVLQSVNLGLAFPGFLKETVEKGKSFVEEHTQAFEHWFDEKVERGRSVVEGKSSHFYEWLKDEKSADLPNIFGVIFNSINIMQYEITKSRLQQYPPDILLSPDLAKVRLLDFDKAEECILEGERIARSYLPHIRQALEWSESIG